MLAVITAMQSEADALLCVSSVQKSFTLCGRKVYNLIAFGKQLNLIVCGVGKVNAAAATQLAIDKLNADVILNIGVAGGINKSMSIGSIYSINRAVQYDFDLKEVNGTAIGTLNEYDTPYLKVLPLNNFPTATLATGDRFNNNIEDLAILNELKADIRDMEGGAIAQTALSNNVPLYMVKSISDVVGSDCVQQYKNNLTKALAALSNSIKIILDGVM